MNSPEFSTQHPQLGPEQVNASGKLTISPESMPVRALAHFVSYIFHPLFIPAYVMAFLLYVHPYAFIGFDDRMKLLRLLSVIVSTLLLPAFSVFLLWRLQFTRTIYLRTQKERIIPYAITMVFYFWVWYVFNNLSDSPLAAKQFLLGVFLSVCLEYMANIWFKISMHGTAMGGMLAFFIVQAFASPSIGAVYLSIALFITGLVCTARLIVGGHTRFEVYSAVFFGIAAQILAVLLA
jgi:hypothetical protein